MQASSPLPDENGRAFSREELAVVRRAYARQMPAASGVDNPAIEAAYAAAPREAFLGPPPDTASSPFTGCRPLSGRDPVVLYQDLSSLSTRRAGSTTAARRCTPNCSRRSRRSPVSASSMSAPARAIIARSWPSWVGPAGQVTAVEFDAALAARAESFLSGRTNVRVICDDGARGRKPRPTGFTSVLPWGGRPIAGSKACLRAAGSSSRSVCLAPSGRIAAAGTATAARRSGSNGAATPTRRAQSALPILSAPKENSRLIPKR